MDKKIYITIFLFLFLINFISADLIVGDIDSGRTNNNIVELFTKEPINVSTVNQVFNMSDFWVTDEGILDNVDDILHSDLSNLLWSTAGHTIDEDVDFNNNNLDEVNNITMIGSLCLDFDCGHRIKTNVLEGQTFNGIAENATIIQHKGDVPGGHISFLVTSNNRTLTWRQVGANNSYSGTGNSFGIIPNYWGEENFTESGNKINMTSLSNYLTICNLFGPGLFSAGDMGCRFGADTRGRGMPLLFTGDLEVWLSTVLHGGLVSIGDADFIMNQNDFDILNGSLHISETKVKTFGFDAGEVIPVLTARFEGTILLPFVQITGGGLTDWTGVSNVLCHDEDCGQALGGAGSPTRRMETNVTTTNLDNINLTFWVTKSEAGGADTLEVFADNNEGSGEVSLFSTTGTIIDTQTNVTLPSSMEDRALVSIIFDFAGGNPTLDAVYIDDVFIQGNATISTLANVTVEDSEIKMGDECFIRQSAEDGFQEINITCDKVNFIANTTFISVTEVELNVTDNATIGNTLFVDKIQNLTSAGISSIANWNFNLFNLTNIGTMIANSIGNFTDRIPKGWFEEIDFNVTINDLFWNTSLEDDVGTLNLYLGGIDGTESEAVIFDYDGVGFVNISDINSTGGNWNISAEGIYFGDGSQLTGVLSGINGTNINVTSIETKDIIVQQLNLSATQFIRAFNTVRIDLGSESGANVRFVLCNSDGCTTVLGKDIGTGVVDYVVGGQLPLNIYRNSASGINRPVQIFGNPTGFSKFHLNLSIADDGNVLLKTNANNIKIDNELNVTGTLTIGTSGSPKNITMYSEDGSEWNCGVNNAGEFKCS